MTVHVQIIDTQHNGAVLEDCGVTVCDNIARALQLYKAHEQAWADKGYETDIVYEMVSTKRPERASNDPR